jgi:hypothetical protein
MSYRSGAQTILDYDGDQKLSTRFDCCFDALALCDRHSKVISSREIRAMTFFVGSRSELNGGVFVLNYQIPWTSLI